MRRAILAAVGLVLLGSIPALSQRGYMEMPPENMSYDGRFTFLRVRYPETTSYSSWGRGRRGGGGREPYWHHDYATGERHLAQMMEELTTLQPATLPRSRFGGGGGVVIDLDDPDFFKYPWAYLCEPGHWAPTAEQTEKLREYMLKGGFVVFDDFADRDWDNFSYQMRRVFPDLVMQELDASHPIFHAFFDFDTLDDLEPPPTRRGVDPIWFGIFENNDPTGRLMGIVNYNNDVGDFWEWSDSDWVPISLTNDAYKLGVNFIIYGITY